MKLTNSKRWHTRAKKVLPNCTQTLSKGQTQFVEGACPIFLSRGWDSTVIDVDGNEYIDIIAALGPVILGYDNQAVNSAIRNQLTKGISFSLPHTLEVTLAEKLTKIIPCAEMVRFVKNGSDACAAAIRIARAATKRSYIASIGYHGCNDWYIKTTNRDRGVEDVFFVEDFSYNDIETLRDEIRTGEYAAVIMEPMSMEYPNKNYLEEIRYLCDEYNTILIFDEVVTGFRLSLGGAQEYFNVIPDLACFGKSMANGMPLSCVVGKKEIMEDTTDVFCSYTFGGETLSLSAALETIKTIENDKVIEYINKQGKKIQDHYNNTAERLELETRCIGMPQHCYFNFGDDLYTKSLFIQEMCENGILTNCLCNIMHSHDDKEINYICGVISKVLNSIANDEVKLKGKQVEQIFRKL